METEPLEAEAELDYEDGLAAEDELVAEDSMEEGELDDSETEAAAAAVRSVLPEGLSADEARRRRTERFGPLASEEAQKLARRRALYASLGLGGPDDGPVHWRAEALHVRGTDTMTTGDVMDYFYKFRPAHVEWVGDQACNVVWMDEQGPVNALLALSSPIATCHPRPAAAAAAPEEDPDALLVGLDTVSSEAPPAAPDTPMTEADGEEAVDPADIKVPVPPGRWRLGVPHRLVQNLFLRFATRGDKRLPGAEQSRAGHVKLYGDPCHRGVAGIITERRRRELRGQSAAEPPPPTGKPNPWGGIAASWATAEAVNRPGRDFDHDPELNLLRDGGRPPDLRRRLEERVEPPRDLLPAPAALKRQRSSSPDSDDQQWRARLKAPRMRMHADDELEKPVTMRRPMRGDLRTRLGSDGGGRWLKNTETTAGERGEAAGRWQARRASPLQLDYEQDEEDELVAPPDQLDLEQPVNIKITRDFSGDELSGEDSEDDVDDSWSKDVDVDRRTDRRSATDLRARLNQKRASTKTERPPLRIEVDNDEYYRLIGSDSE